MTSEPSTQRVSKISYCYVALLVFVLVSNSLYGEYDDEWDNILGGLRMAQGMPLYSHYFAHHFPLPYFISALIHSIVGPNFVGFRILFALLLATVSLQMIHRFKSGTSKDYTPQTYFLILALGAPLAWMQMLHAETLIAYSLVYFLFALWREDALTTKDIAVMSGLCSVVALSSLGYIFLACTLTGVTACAWWFVTRGQSSEQRWRSAAAPALSALTPWLIIALYLALTGGIHDFFWQNFTFNQKYYFIYAGATPGDPFGALLYVLASVGNGIVQTFLRLDAGWYVSVYALMLCAIAGFLIKQRGNYWRVLATVLITVFALSRFSPAFDFANNRNVPLYPIGLFCIFELVAPLCARIKFPRRTLAVLALIFCSVRFFTQPQISNVDAVAESINRYLPPNEQYWIGPFRFRPQYFVHAEPASRYSFFLPWHGASPEITKELIGDLERHKPAIVMFDYDLVIWGHAIKDYGRPLVRYIAREYRHVTIPNQPPFMLVRKDSALSLILAPNSNK